MAFDPFGDFEQRGYLRNYEQFKNPQDIKTAEHLAFRANINEAINYLGRAKEIRYKEFLNVHRILFSDFYPWSGQDRLITAPELAISKSDTVMFCHPVECARVVSFGLNLAKDPKTMRTKPGEVMGLFAFGHPFLDGNGRTMLLVHTELCFRAGFSISWHRSDKAAYLDALTREIALPGKGILDQHLIPLMTDKISREQWSEKIISIQGLDGIDDGNIVNGLIKDSEVAAHYREFENRRGYTIEQIEPPQKKP